MKESAATIHATNRDQNRHWHFFLLLIPSLVFALSIALFLRNRWKMPLPLVTQTSIATAQIMIGNIPVTVKLSKTVDEHNKGLSGVTSMPENEGMLFIFPSKARPAFWMKDMIIPLDFIWIADNKVIQIDKDVKAPPFGTTDANLKLYLPNELIDHVLEVNAGFSEKNNIKVGDSVDLSTAL